ncbi:MAG: L,D-transpeptidase [Myxococcales bacterium]|nr:L,D-transpeptidase [Myxococcales bacterium]
MVVAALLGVMAGSCMTTPPPPLGAPPADSVVHVHVDRAGRTLSVLRHGSVVSQQPIGIGRGGLAVKERMGDYVTPTGTFVVDLILHDAGSHDAVSPDVVERFADDAEFAELLADDAGLRQLWRNMKGIDFDGDGLADAAYGSAYIGLAATGGEVTGPKMSRYADTARWFSIALHGTPDPSTLGAAASGGCVHLGADLLTDLIEGGQIGLGSLVTIADGPPP